MASTGFADTSNSGFSDINKSYAKDAILELQSKGILNGIDSSHFNPKGVLNRVEFVTIMVKALGLDTSATTSSFSDVPDWAVSFVEAAYKAGIISGTGGGKFAPNTSVTREMAVVILVRSLQSQGKLSDDATLNFTDTDEISDWAKQSIAIAQKYRLITGTADGKFNPKGEANREMVAVMGSPPLLTAIDTLITPETTPVPTPPPPPTPAPIIPPVGGGGGDTTPVDKTLTSIPIIELPTKLSYKFGEEFDINGIVV